MGTFQIVWLLLVVLAFWMFFVRPQRRRMLGLRALQTSLAVGDDVVTTSGIYGVIRALEPDTVDLEVAPGTVLRFAPRAAIAAKQPVAAPPSDHSEG